MALAASAEMTESQIEWQARQSSNRVLDVATDGAYTTAVAAAVKGIRTPTPADTFVIVTLDQTVFNLFPDEHGDRRRNSLFHQIEFDANAMLDATSAKGAALSERRDTLHFRWRSMPTDQQVKYAVASYVADE